MEAVDEKLNLINFSSQEEICHEGSKACKVVYCGDTGRVFTVGFSRFSDRQYSVWDDKNLNTPLRQENIDSSSGILTPYYDHDTKIVFVGGKVLIHFVLVITFINCKTENINSCSIA